MNISGRETIITDKEVIKQIIKELTSEPSEETIKENEEAKQAFLKLTKVG